RSYVEIQQAGGGILATVAATRAASDEELVASTRARLDRLLAHGVTTCEAKSGYALDPDGELRLLRLLGAIDHPVALAPTLLAHVVPPGEDRARYVDAFCALVARAPCEAVDVFCDRGAFTLDETRRILEAARAAGQPLRLHAEQLSHTG